MGDDPNGIGCFRSVLRFTIAATRLLLKIYQLCQCRVSNADLVF